MREIKWNENWKFWQDKGAFALVWNVPEIARDITLPHDAMIETPACPDSPSGGNTGYRNGDVYTYVKMLYAPEDYRDKTVMLKFEGIYMNAFVYVNEQLAAKCPYGYTGFYVSLNEHLRYGQENEIRVLVKNSNMPNSRWYSGSGIYRDVYLLVSDTVYMEPDGVQIATDSFDEALAVVTVATELKSRRYNTTAVRLETMLYAPDGTQVATDVSYATMYEGGKRTLKQRMAIEAPQGWSEETPALYTCISRLYEGEQLLDESENLFGLRTLDLDAKRGLRVNGKEVKLRGACIHHDSGLLGAATYEAAQYRQVKMLKEAGFNAIRMSHHPAAPALLRACDQLGVYVMDETFDMWTRCKSDNDYAHFFDKWWKEDVTAMVRKDFNHPSVVMYSVGNEIPEIGTDLGAEICGQIDALIKTLDTTRYTTAGINGVFAAGDQIGRIMDDLQKELQVEGEMDANGNVNDFMTLMDENLDKIVQHAAISERLEYADAGMDIIGYNYMTARYEPDGKAYPNRVIVGSETYPPEIARNWAIIKNVPHVIGDFTWTGWDYIGEAGVGVVGYTFGEGGFGAMFPCQLAYVGDIDITGFRRPTSYFREAVFGLRKDPYITVQNPYRYGQKDMKTVWVISDNRASWTYDDCNGKPVVIEVYAPGDEVELFKNGISLGKKPAGDAAGYRVLYETTYEPGELLAIAYQNGVKIGCHVLKTAQEMTKLQLTAEEFSDDAVSLIYVDAVAVDEAGTTCDAEELILTAKVEGPATLLGFGSGNPKPTYNYITEETQTFYGKAQLILKRTGSGAVKVTVTADGKDWELTV